MGLSQEIEENTEEKIRGNFFLFAYGVNDLSHLSCFDQIQNDKCLNDGRCIMPFVASVPFWFLAKAHITYMV